MTGRIELVKGDITKQPYVDAIVNAANPYLAPGGGVCGAIHKAGGPAIAFECEEILERYGETPVGDSKVTTAGDLDAKYVVHAVGPVWDPSQGRRLDSYLLLAYLSAQRRGYQFGCRSMAFPSISTGIYGYPISRAAALATYAVRRHPFELVRFVLWDDETFDAFRKAMPWRWRMRNPNPSS